jgi:hypothetical protein
MLQHTSFTVHLGVGCLFAPSPVIELFRVQAFEKALADRGLQFTSRNLTPGAVHLHRDPDPLDVQLTTPANGPPVASFAVLAPGPWATVQEFTEQAVAAYESYATVWTGQTLQVVQREVTLRRLFSVAESSAWEYLWQRRLAQEVRELQAFGRPVLGGGLRFVLPPDDEQPHVELKIESFFPDPTKLFVELQMKWMKPQILEGLGDPAPLIQEADRFIDEDVCKYVMGDNT